MRLGEAVRAGNTAYGTVWLSIPCDVLNGTLAASGHVLITLSPARCCGPDSLRRRNRIARRR